MDDGPAPEKVPIKLYEDQAVENDVAVPDEMPRVTNIRVDMSDVIYKMHLKDMLFKRIAMANMQEEMVSIYADFGYEVAQELLKVK